MLASLILCAVLRLRERNLDTQIAPDIQPQMKDWRAWELYPLAGLAAFILLWDLYALDVLPTRIWETLHYRAVTVGLWMQGAPLRGFEASSWASFSYPANAELLQLWWCIHTHSDRWIELPQWLSALALADIVGLLAKDAGAPTPACIWAAALSLLIAVIGIQAATEQDDLVTGAAFAAGLVLTRRWLVKHDDSFPMSKFDVAMTAGAAMGLALGAKVTLIPLLVPVLLWMFIALWKGQRCWKETAAFAVPFVAIGFYFYADNYFRLGNPLYPFPVRLFGFELFQSDPARHVPEMVPGTVNLANHLRQAPLEWFDAHADVPAYSEATGFGPLWSALILPALGFQAFLQRRTWRALPNGNEQSGATVRSLWCLGLVVGAGQILLWSTTSWTRYDLRYMLHMPALATVAAAVCWWKCPWPWRALPSGMAIVLGALTCANVAGNNWNTPILKIAALHSLPFEERTYARLNTMPEALLFATLDAGDVYPEAGSVALLSESAGLKSPAFGVNFQRTVWLPDAPRMTPEGASGRWKREADARKIDAVLLIDCSQPFDACGYAEARCDLADPARWKKVYSKEIDGRRLTAYRKIMETH